MNTTQISESKPVIRKRPILVWIIALFLILSAGSTTLSFILVYSEILSITETQKAYFNSLNSFDIIGSLAIYLLNISGAFLLLSLKRNAYHFFLVAFVIGLLMTFYHAFLTRNWIHVVGSLSLGQTIIGWAVNIWIIIYSKKLIEKNILK